jgi:hypothetical protein
VFCGTVIDDENLLWQMRLGGGAIATIAGTMTEFTWGTGQGFSADNSHRDEATGSHLRVNNPLGAQIEFSLPTTGYENPVLEFEARRSTQGAGSYSVWFTAEGSNYAYHSSHALSAVGPEVFTFDLSRYPQTFNYPSFSVVLSFHESTLGGLVGNVRIDNVSLTGSSTTRGQQTAWITAIDPKTPPCLESPYTGLDTPDSLRAYDPPTGMWYVLTDWTDYSTVRFGFDGTLPLAGDYDGDGITDLAVYHPPTGVWYFVGSLSGFSSRQLGYGGTKVVTFMGSP